MKRILIVGAGDVAGRAIPWLARRFRVFALTRRPEGCERLRRLGAVPLLADLDDRASLARLAGIADAVLHFAPPPAQGPGDARTQRLLAALAGGRVTTASDIHKYDRVYGDCAGQRIDETRPAGRPRRARRRVDAERRLRVFGAANAVAVSILRAPGIYAADRLPLERLRRGDPVLQPDEDVFTNHVHAEDLARMACLALFRGRAGRVYNAVDQSDMKMGEYFELAAGMFGVAPPPRLPRVELAQKLSPMALSFMSESRRIDGARVLRELRMRLIHPTVADGFAAAIAEQGKPAC